MGPRQYEEMMRTQQCMQHYQTQAMQDLANQTNFMESARAHTEALQEVSKSIDYAFNGGFWNGSN